MKKLLLTLLAVMVTVAVNAERVSWQEALQKARQFMPGKQFMETKSFSRSERPDNNEPFYIFNAENNGGFVIVGGDNRMKSILGYAEHGSFDLGRMPENVRWWLGEYTKALENYGKSGTAVRAKRSATRGTSGVKEAIAPFITTTWGQDSPYNNQCPTYHGNNCLTGCIATAMAQVMNYTRWPEGPTGEIVSYTTETLNLQVPKLSAKTFNWDSMTDDEIASLMRYCGQSVGIDYGLDNSGAYDARIPGAMIGKFGYDKGLRIVYRNGYNIENWETMIYNELKAGRPVIYGGQSITSGHSFICHGYQDGMFYINWGWDGLFDGYFTLTALNPDGTGSYGQDQTAIIGIQKPTGDVAVSNSLVTVTKLELLSNETVTRASASADFTEITIKTILQHAFMEEGTAQIGFALYRGTELKKVLGYSNMDITPGFNMTFNAIFSFGSGLADGVYRIVPIYRESETSDWVADEGSDWRYVQAVISGNSLIQKVMPDAAHDERLKFNPISADEAEVSAANQEIEGDIIIPEAVEIDGKLYKVTAVAAHGFSYCKKVTSIKMPSSMLYWFLGAFEGCSQLKTLTIPKSLKLNTMNGMWTMEYCISMCDNLTELIVEEGNTDFCVENGALLTAKKDYLMGYVGGLTQKEYTLPESVESIAWGAFMGAKYLEVINWNSKLPGFPIQAFSCCSSLKEIHNIDHITIIQEGAFDGTGIENLKLPPNLKEIGIRSFVNCEKLKSLEIPQSLMSIGDYAFADCPQLESIVVRKGYLSINANIFSEETYQKATLYVPKGRARIYKNSAGWENFKSIEEIDMPDVIISDNPFENIDESQMLFGYYRSDEYSELFGYGGQAAGTYKAFISFSKESIQPFVGASINHFRFALIDKNISDVYFWIGSSRDKKDIYKQAIGNVNVGWNVLSLEKPYVITGDSIFMGIEYNSEGNVYPISYILGDTNSSDSRAAEPGSACFYGPYGENNEYEWLEEDNKCLAMQCILEGDHLPLYDIHVTSMVLNDPDPYYYKYDSHARVQFALFLKNWGKKLIGNDFHIKGEIDGKDIIGGDYYGLELDQTSAAYKVYSFNLPDNLSVGLHKVKIYVDEVCGEKPLFPNDDFGTYTFRVYKEGMNRQKILIENITSTWCHDALNTNNRQDVLLKENDDLALVAYHCQDELTSNASEEFFKKYECGIIGLVLDANRHFGSDSYYFAKLREMPSFADVNINAEYDKNKRLLKIIVEGDKNSEFDILHASSNLSVYLTEDNLVAPQYDEMNNTWITDYKHKGVLQDTASNLWGDPIIWHGNHYKMSYYMRLNQEWNTDNMHIIAFIEEDLEGKTTGKPVINCNSFDLKNAKIVDVGELLSGDADCNKVIDQKDVEAVTDFIMTTEEPESFNWWNAEMNDDRKVNVIDIVKIVNHLKAK